MKFVLLNLSLVSAAYLVVHQTPPIMNTLSLPHPSCYKFRNTSKVWCKYEELPQSLHNIEVLEEEGSFQTTACQYNPPWHLQRLVTKKPNYAVPYTVTEGADTYIYIVDTWLDTKHPEFQGRASTVFSNVYGFKNFHGTHVAGIASSKSYGVSKSARIFSVQVLDDSGRGRWSALIEALSFISNHAAQRRTTSIVNLSLAGSPSRAVDMAITQLYRQGLFIVAAAGNDGRKACDYSPARSKQAYTVAASDRYDNFVDFSNWGMCVNITAPGDQILSALPNNNAGYMSGTSMAAPVVAGLASVYVSKNPQAKPWEIAKYLDAVALRGVINDLYYTKDRLAHSTLTDTTCKASGYSKLLFKFQKK